MKNNFLQKIMAAGRLVRGGKLAEATASIQRALASADAAAPLAASAAPPAASPVRARAASADSTVAEREPPRRDPVGDAAWVETGVFVTESEVAEPPVVAPTAAEPDVARSGAASFVESSFTCAAGTRSFKLFTPAGLGDAQVPLVVMLHGCTQDPDDFAAGTRMNELAQEAGFMVLYPAQAARSNAHKCWNWFVPGDQRRGQGEPALLAGMTRHVMQTHRVDEARVFVAGLSAGAAMAAILAREYADLFAAAGVHSGIAPGVASDVASAFSVMSSGPAGAGGAAAWQSALPGAKPAVRANGRDSARAARRGAPVIVFHGDADSTVVAANGDAVVSAALAADPNSRRVDSDQPAATGARAYRRSIWRSADASAEAPSRAEQWLVRGAPHAWSGGAAAGSYTDPAGPDASREMLRFFLEHPRPVTAS